MILSYAYIALQKHQEAIPHLREVLQHEPDNDEFLKAYIVCLENLLENKID